MAFPTGDAAELLIACKRYCCVCWRRCGFRIELHHIKPRAEGGSDNIDNAIPVCFDCHAEIESSGPRGRRFTENELHEHKRRWLKLVEENPGALIDAAQRETQTGPLEALHAELDYNAIALSGPLDEGFPPLATRQFERAIAANALLALPDISREAVHRVYATFNRVNYHLHEMAVMDRAGGSGGSFAATREVVKELRRGLSDTIRAARNGLEKALGRDAP